MRCLIAVLESGALLSDGSRAVLLPLDTEVRGVSVWSNGRSFSAPFAETVEEDPETGNVVEVQTAIDPIDKLVRVETASLDARGISYTAEFYQLATGESSDMSDVAAVVKQGVAVWNRRTR